MANLAINFTANNVKGTTLGYLGPKSKALPLLKNTNKDIVDGIQIAKWPVYATTSKDIPLRTSGMVCCCAFIIQTPTKHYMMHLNPIHSEVNEIVMHLQRDFPQLTNKTTKLSIIPGCFGPTRRTVETLLKALSIIDSSLPDKVKYYHFPEESIKFKPTEDIDNPLAVVSYNGKLFYMSKRARSVKFKNGGKSISPRIYPIDT